MTKKKLLEVIVLKAIILGTCVTNILQILDTPNYEFKAIRNNYIIVGILTLVAMLGLLGAAGKNRKIASQLLSNRKTFIMMTYFLEICLLMNKQIIVALPLFEQAGLMVEYNTSLAITHICLIIMIIIELGYINLSVTIKNMYMSRVKQDLEKTLMLEPVKQHVKQQVLKQSKQQRKRVSN